MNRDQGDRLPENFLLEKDDFFNIVNEPKLSRIQIKAGSDGC